MIALLTALLGPALPAAAVDWPAVGRVNVTGLSFCTGALIGPDRVVTAAHCLFHPRTGELAPLDDIHFVAGWDRGSFVAHAKPRAVRIAVGYDWHHRRALVGLERDLAILEFAEPVAIPALAVDRQADGSGRLAMVHYSHRRPHLADVDEGCIRLGRVGRLWQLDCAVEAGSSGAPVLAGGANGPSVAAIVIGRTRSEDRWTTLALPVAAAYGLPLP